MRYKPERALTLEELFNQILEMFRVVEMRYKPERALTLEELFNQILEMFRVVEMRYKPERALTLNCVLFLIFIIQNCRNEV